MRALHHDGNTWFLVFDRGDEFVDALTHFAAEHHIHGAHFSGLGAFEKMTISWWNCDTKEYEKHEINEQVEVLSIMGDVGIFNGEVKVHAHATLGRRDLSAIGGHVFSGLVRPTLEVQLVSYSTSLVRKVDPASKLPLL